nr:tetratricopeptide repeat protein [Lunatimonas salinarum]
MSSWYQVPDLFSQYFEPEQELSGYHAEAYGSFFERAIEAYQSGKYEDAITLTRSVLDEHPDSDTLKYLLGTSHLALKQAKPAIYYLQGVVKDSKSSLQPKALWNLGLAFVLEGDRRSAKATLEKSNHPRAKELANELTDP